MLKADACEGPMLEIGVDLRCTRKKRKRRNCCMRWRDWKRPVDDFLATHRPFLLHGV